MYLSDAYGALVDDDAHAPRARSAYSRATCDTHTAPTADAPDQICIVRAEDMAPGQPLRSRHDADAWPRPRRQPPLGRLLPYGASPPSLLLPASRTPRRPTPPLSRTHSQRSLASSPRSSPGVAVGTRSVIVVTPTFNNTGLAPQRARSPVSEDTRPVRGETPEFLHTVTTTRRINSNFERQFSPVCRPGAGAVVIACR